MGAAIEQGLALLRDRKEIYKANGISYYRPWVFLITDGGPTDAWANAAAQVKQGEADKAFSFFAIGVQDANMQVLSQTRSPLALRNCARDLFTLSASSAPCRGRTGDTVPLAPRDAERLGVCLVLGAAGPRHDPSAPRTPSQACQDLLGLDRTAGGVFAAVVSDSARPPATPRR
jgi:hypothetical protein